MHTYTLVSAVLAGASLVLAGPAPKPAPAPMITPAPVAHLVQRALLPRTHGGDDDLTPLESSCYSKYQSIMNNVPSVSPNANFGGYLLSKANAVQTVAAMDFESICSIIYDDSDLPASIASSYRSYTNKVNSFASSIKPEISSLGPQCGALNPMLDILIITDEKSCKTAYQQYVAAFSISDERTSETTRRAQTAEYTLRTGSGAATSTVTTAAIQETASAEQANAPSGSAASSISTAGAAGPMETGYMAFAAAAAMAVGGAMAAL